MEDEQVLLHIYVRTSRRKSNWSTPLFPSFSILLSKYMINVQILETSTSRNDESISLSLWLMVTVDIFSDEQTLFYVRTM